MTQETIKYFLKDAEENRRNYETAIDIFDRGMNDLIKMLAGLDIAGDVKVIRIRQAMAARETLIKSKEYYEKEVERCKKELLHEVNLTDG